MTKPLPQFLADQLERLRADRDATVNEIQRISAMLEGAKDRRAAISADIEALKDYDEFLKASN